MKAFMKRITLIAPASVVAIYLVVSVTGGGGSLSSTVRIWLYVGGGGGLGLHFIVSILFPMNSAKKYKFLVA